MQFEILIPTNEDGFDATLTVEAGGWFEALRAALTRHGETLQRGLLCRVEEGGGLVVTDAERRRVYFVRPLDDDILALGNIEEPEGPGDTLEMSPAERRDLVKSFGVDATLPRGRAARVLRARRTPSGSFPAVVPTAAPDQTLIDRVQREIEWVHETDRSFQEVSDALLSLALDLIPSDAGCVLFPGVNGKVLHFAAIQGPRADEARGMSIPINEGMAGFCIREGVSLIVNDPLGDSRFRSAINDSLQYRPRDVLCSPLLFDGRVYGAMELFDREGGLFTYPDLALLNHIGSQLAQYVALQI